MPGAPVQVVGLSPGGLALPAGAGPVLAGAEVLAGGRRLLAAFPDHPARRVPIAGPLAGVLAVLRAEAEAGRRVVVLADGDPLFFGIGRRLLAEFGPQALVFHPHLTALQAAAARLGLAWDGVEAVSLHGRSDLSPFFSALSRAPQVAVFTDPANTPALVARSMLDRGAADFLLTVCEDLGAPGERVSRLTPAEAAGREFSNLNLVLVERTKEPEAALRLGLPDAFFEREAGLMTKGPVRAAGLALLGIEPGHTVWDVGAGCGSVAVEAAALAWRGRVLALEREPGRADMVRRNAARAGAWHVETVCGEAPQALGGLPDPDRIFVGGGLSSAPDLLGLCLDRLPPGGRLAAHIILLDGLHRAVAALRERAASFGVVQVQAAESEPLARDLRLAARNPVFVVWAARP